MPAVARSKRSAASLADEDGIVYADTSALVKLVVHEAETDVLTEQVSGWERVASSEIAAIELPRAVARARHDGRADVADDRTVLEVLRGRADPAERRRARVRGERASAAAAHLDAVHLAGALTLGDDLELVVTYDDRLHSAAESAGARTARPAWAEHRFIPPRKHQVRLSHFVGESPGLRRSGGPRVAAAALRRWSPRRRATRLRRSKPSLARSGQNAVLWPDPSRDGRKLAENMSLRPGLHRRETLQTGQTQGKRAPGSHPGGRGFESP
jgi:predicted nucleic acid-binding protein